MKKCSVCSNEKALTEFHKDSRLKSGIRADCKTCVRAKQAAAYLSNPEPKKKKATLRNSLNREAHNNATKKWYAKNAKASCLVSKKWRDLNSLKMESARAAWRENNHHLVIANRAKRRAAEKNRTPTWLTKADYRKMAGFYRESKRLQKLTGIDFHVDHEIPLLGKNVSGLHVPENLRVIPAFENLRKSNMWEGT